MPPRAICSVMPSSMCTESPVVSGHGPAAIRCHAFLVPVDLSKTANVASKRRRKSQNNFSQNPVCRRVITVAAAFDTLPLDYARRSRHRHTGRHNFASLSLFKVATTIEFFPKTASKMDLMGNMADSADCPAAMQPVYEVGTINAPLLLHEGELSLQFSGQSRAVQGIIRFEWLPCPRVVFEIPNCGFHIALEQDNLAIDCRPLDRPVKAVLTRKDFTFRNGEIRWSLRGIPSEAGFILRRGVAAGSDLAYLIFHLANFCDFTGSPIRAKGWNWLGRAVMEDGMWRVTLDSVNWDANLRRELKASKGYAITHIGRLERLDGHTFSLAEAEELLSSLSWFFTFCRGAWCAPVLPVGFDRGGNPICERWGSPRVDPAGTEQETWFNRLSSEGLSKVFPRFQQRFSEPLYAEPIKHAIHWYVEANKRAGGMEGSIILVQAALELLVWTVLVEALQKLSRAGFDRLPASDKLRPLLAECDIPLEIPDLLGKLIRCAKGMG